MSAQKHVIQRAVIALDLSDKDKRQELQEEVSLVFYQQLLPVIEKIFDRNSDPEYYQRIARMEINLDDFRQYQSREDLEKIIEQNLQKQLRKTLPEEAPKVSRENHLIDEFLYFLEKGFWMWSFKGARVEEIQGQLMELKEGERRKFFSRLFSKVLLSNNLRKRILRQCDPAFFEWLISEEIPGEDFLKYFRTILEKNVLTANQKEAFQEALLITLAKNRIEQVNGDSKSVKKQIAHILKSIVDDPGHQLPLDKEKRFNDSHNKKSTFEEKILATSDLLTSYSEKKGPDLDSYVYVNGAGIILLHPYLETLFEELGLLQDKEFISLEDQERAVYLLHFLVNDQEHCNEEDSTLFKLLCGLELDYPLRNTISISTKEKEEAAQLLEAVIHNWAKLKNTSPGGLREAFLQREGRLSAISNGWQLRVEQKPIDVLLQYLPWGIGLVKLPWMEEMLMVDWG